MKRIKNYQEFLNEDNKKLWGLATSLMGQMFSGGFDPKATTPNTGGDSPVATTNTSGGRYVAGPSGPEATRAVQTVTTSTLGKDNDDFLLYMQHQQGIAGSKQLIRASKGIDKLHPETVKTKSGTKYANLVMNIPSDRPQVKAALIKALDAGDHKEAANLFLEMWKEKWKSKGAQGMKMIEEPKYKDIKNYIMKYCLEYKVPFDFAVTVATIESGLNPKTGNKRYKGVYALSQEEFARRIPGGNIYNAEQNIKAGVQHLRDNIKQFQKYLGSDLAGLNFSPWTKSLA